MVCTLAVTQALIRHRKTQLFLQTDKCNSDAETTSTHGHWGYFVHEFGRLGSVLTTPGVWGFSKVHLILFFFFCNKVKAGTTPAALSFLSGAVCANLGCASPLRPTSLHLDWQASLAVVRRHQHRGSLGSAAKVNNECIFFLHITRRVMLLILCQLCLFSVSVSATLVDVEDV